MNGNPIFGRLPEDHQSADKIRNSIDLTKAKKALQQTVPHFGQCVLMPSKPSVMLRKSPKMAIPQKILIIYIHVTRYIYMCVNTYIHIYIYIIICIYI